MNSKTFHEKKTLLQLKKGDFKAFEMLYNKYFSSVFGYCYKYLKIKEDTEEVVQNLFLKIWERREDINTELSFKSFLFQIAYNDMMNYFNVNKN